MPISRSVRRMRTAISPRLATSTLRNIARDDAVGAPCDQWARSIGSARIVLGEDPVEAEERVVLGRQIDGGIDEPAARVTVRRDEGVGVDAHVLAARGGTITQVVGVLEDEVRLRR